MEFIIEGDKKWGSEKVKDPSPINKTPVPIHLDFQALECPSTWR
jgi:hypothetical protein